MEEPEIVIKKLIRTTERTTVSIDADLLIMMLRAHGVRIPEGESISVSVDVPSESISQSVNSDNTIDITWTIETSENSLY